MAMNKTKMCDIAILANGKDCISTSTDTPDTRNTFTSRLAIPRVNRYSLKLGNLSDDLLILSTRCRSHLLDTLMLAPKADVTYSAPMLTEFMAKQAKCTSGDKYVGLSFDVFPVSITGEGDAVRQIEPFGVRRMDATDVHKEKPSWDSYFQVPEGVTFAWRRTCIEPSSSEHVYCHFKGEPEVHESEQVAIMRRLLSDLETALKEQTARSEKEKELLEKTRLDSTQLEKDLKKLKSGRQKTEDELREVLSENKRLREKIMSFELTLSRITALSATNATTPSDTMDSAKRKENPSTAGKTRNVRPRVASSDIPVERPPLISRISSVNILSAVPMRSVDPRKKTENLVSRVVSPSSSDAIPVTPMRQTSTPINTPVSLPRQP